MFKKPQTLKQMYQRNKSLNWMSSMLAMIGGISFAKELFIFGFVVILLGGIASLRAFKYQETLEGSLMALDEIFHSKNTNAKQLSDDVTTQRAGMRAINKEFKREIKTLRKDIKEAKKNEQNG